MSALPQTELAVTFDDVILASERIGELVHKTPVLTSRLFDERAGTRVFFKCENLQRGGAFKIRGAMNFLLQLSPEERRRGVVTFSSGNHAQAVAIAAAHLGVHATIVMPKDAPKAKIAATEAYRPEIIFFDRFKENREELAGRIAKETGAVVCPSYDHPYIIAGQGTAVLELLREQRDLDGLAVPLGGGGLLSGSLVVATALNPPMQVFGVEPALANDWEQSMQRGERVEIPPPQTIADGLRTPVPGKITFPIVKEFVEEVLVVSEEEIKETVRFLLTRLKILAEPSGAVAAAAALHGKLPRELRNVGIVLSGGNVDLDVLAGICNE